MTTLASMSLDHELDFVDSGKPTAGRILEVVPPLDPRLGGISAVVPRLASELIDSFRFDITLCSFDDSANKHASSLQTNVPLSVWPSSRGAWLRHATLRNDFRTLVRRADALHIHGLWEAGGAVAARLARSAGKPYVVSAHGMLEPWALANKSLKKRVYSALVERANLHGATCLHALTEAEAEDYRRFGCKQPIAVIPNGVDAPPSAIATRFLTRFPQLTGKQILLFLGRIHFKKGLDLLVEAWASLARQFPNAVLILAGPDSEDSMASVQKLIDRHSLADRVVFTGMLDGELKWSALAAATCFVLPSYSEGLSVAVLEALSMGVPVVVSEQCRIPQIERCGAGWIVKTEVPALRQALQTVLENDCSLNAAVGSRGKALAKEYRWHAVAGKMAELYQWIAGGPRPRSFVLEGPSA